MTRDEFLKTLFWTSRDGPLPGSRVLIVTSEYPSGNKVQRNFLVTEEDQTTLRHLDIWLADRLLFMQELALVDAGFTDDPEAEAADAIGAREYEEERGR